MLDLVALVSSLGSSLNTVSNAKLTYYLAARTSSRMPEHRFSFVSVRQPALRDNRHPAPHVTSITTKIPTTDSIDNDRDIFNLDKLFLADSCPVFVLEQLMRKPSFMSCTTRVFALSFCHRAVHYSRTSDSSQLYLFKGLRSRLARRFTSFRKPSPDKANQEVKELGIDAHFVHKTVIIPHDDKRERGGEDGASTSDRFLVLADGVGGWASSNVDPGLFSRSLTSNIVEAGSKLDLPLAEIIHNANWQAAAEHLGSATCTALQLIAPDTISTVNIGDSGYSIHRRNPEMEQWEPIYISKPGQKSFNFPHQLGGQFGDKVDEVADLKNHTLEPNDIVVLFSDGVSDNLAPKSFGSCLEYATNSDGEIFSLSIAADAIARKAYFLSKDPNYVSPFAQEARAAGISRNEKGGKEDDISCIVAQIQSGPASGNATGEQTSDPHYQDAITLCQWPIAPLNAIPSLNDLDFDPHKW